MSVVISDVEKNSPAAKKGLTAGLVLHTINGHAINDVLDYRFYMLEKKLVMGLCDQSGHGSNIVIHKDEYDDPGLLFDTYLMDTQKSCRNKCCFCFIDQLPGGMRESLYFKDDDSRLSFLFGNYITLTNLFDSDIERIIKMHISPVNISVHTMNPALRVEMMKNPRAGEVLKYIPMLCKAGIKVNAQLVLCPGMNDGAELERSLSELSSLGENLQSVSSVPIGLTKFREGLSPQRLFTKAEAASVISTIDSFGEKRLKEYGTRTFYASDEFYLTAKIPLPEYDYYEDFYQLENGVGMSTMLEYEFMDALDFEDTKTLNRHITIATGTAAFGLIAKLAGEAEKKFPKLKIDVVPIKNNFFGENITVAGLVTGGDIIDRLSGRNLGSELLFPSSMLRFDGDLFLDDTTIPQLEKALGIPAVPVDNSGQALLDAMLGNNPL